MREINFGTASREEVLAWIQEMVAQVEDGSLRAELAAGTDPEWEANYGEQAYGAALAQLGLIRPNEDPPFGSGSSLSGPSETDSANRGQRVSHPWKDLSVTWYAALVDGPIYGLARRRPGLNPDGATTVHYEAFDRETGTWHKTTAGASYFTGIGGVTDAEPIDEATARGIVSYLRPGSTLDDVSAADDD